jgi:hypothetical protein
MKAFKFLSNTALVFSLVLLASCSSNDDFEETGYKKQKLEFKAVIESSDVTRATLEGDYTVSWDENDEISVFCDNAEDSQAFGVTPSSTDGKTATFTNYGGQLPLWFEPNESYYALYPKASATLDVRSASITATLPTNQIVSSSRTYDKRALFMAACANMEERIFNFKNITALVKVTVSNNAAGKVRFIEIESKNPANILSGNFKVSPLYNSSRIGYESISGADKKHTVKLQIPAIEEAQDFYLAVLPGIVNGLTLKFEDGTSTVLAQHGGSNTIEFRRSKIYDFGSYDIENEVK